MIKIIILLGLISSAANAAVIDCKTNTCINTSTGGREVITGTQVAHVITKPAYYRITGELELPRVCVDKVNDIGYECFDQVTVFVTVNKISRLNGVVVK